jgi:rhodanese-related sulfurtransferase
MRRRRAAVKGAAWASLLVEPHAMKTLVGIFVVAAAATLGDYVWYTYGVRHSLVSGLIHGTLLLTAVGLVLGLWSGRVLKGLPIGAIAGIGGALSYYLLIAIMDRRTYGTAIPGAWMIMWLLLAALDGRWLRAPQRRTWAEVAGRGVAAALLASAAFYIVLDTLWGLPPAGGRNYAVQFLAWAFAWAPGLLALTLGGAGKAITSAELLARIDRGEKPFILDVRSRSEFSSGHVPGAVNIPFNQVPFRIGEVPGTADDEIIAYCGHGPRACIAGAALDLGRHRRIVYLTGHFSAWKAAKFRIES